MMYTNRTLEQETMFKMKSGDFNALVNSLEVEGETPVKVSLLIRTKDTNRVALVEEHSLRLVGDIHPFENKGYFSVLYSIKNLLQANFGHLNEGIMMRDTVLMPVGAFKDHDSIHLYFNLILMQEDLEDIFSINDSIRFVDIQDTNLINLEEGSIMILPTLTLVDAQK